MGEPQDAFADPVVNIPYLNSLSSCLFFSSSLRSPYLLLTHSHFVAVRKTEIENPGDWNSSVSPRTW